MSFILNTVLEFLAAHRRLAAVTGLLLALAGLFAYLTHEKRIETRKRIEAEREANRRREQTEGMKIILNSQTGAAEIEREKQSANILAVNTNIAAENLSRVRNANLNSFNANYDAARRRFCREIGPCSEVTP